MGGVIIELVILILGVFIGLQVDNGTSCAAPASTHVIPAVGVDDAMGADRRLLDLRAGILAQPGVGGERRSPHIDCSTAERDDTLGLGARHPGSSERAGNRFVRRPAVRQPSTPPSGPTSSSTCVRDCPESRQRHSGAGPGTAATRRAVSRTGISSRPNGTWICGSTLRPLCPQALTTTACQCRELGRRLGSSAAPRCARRTPARWRGRRVRLPSAA